ncbi:MULTISPECIES: anti-sigma F factor antagonist [unclassified Clostridium]|uniref:anti-sigma F factor antagonist n=1 Tax=unclassified Clostridium TaxID=2614128 RepID=UPI001EEABAA1|nr:MULTISPECIES: anti-sigma F factor antagonist [unclassified Clostridium]MDD7794560.1 anti-sigma F factor antagonist [Clostridium sp. 'White wine YQ']
MYLKFNKSNDKLIVTLRGELDHHSAEEVRVKIDDRIDRDGVKNLILDFSAVTFMDSSGIGVVIGRYKKLSSKSGKVVIAEATKNVKRVFELSGLFKIIKAYDSIEEAINCNN